MRVVVTGATGNVGTSLLEHLVADEQVSSVLGVARRAPAVTQPDVSWAEADVAVDDLTPLLDGAGVVVHLAWLFQPTHDPLVTWQANVIGSERVFNAAARARVGAVVHASSVGAYSPGAGDRSDRVDESWPTHSLPTAAYGREKGYVERLLDAFEARHPEIRVVRLRPGFVFQRASATQQRRLFAGPFVPGRLLEPGRLPLLPVPSGLRFQAVHSQDIAAAYHAAVVRDVTGAYNIAAEPVVDGEVLADLLGTKPVEVPRPLMRLALAAAWWAHLTPADPALADLALGLPLLDTSRARRDLDWSPRVNAVDAVGEMLEGLRTGAGLPTPPLAPDTPARRAGEVASGVGERP